MGQDGQVSADEATEAAVDRLYAAEPDEFMALRGELAKAAKADGDAAAAKAIGALRKPTVPASVVNRYALHDASAGERLTELGDRMRRAQRDYDAGLLRELSAERRTLVAELTAAAFEHAGRLDPTTAQRDEVSNTFDAAVADPDVAGRLGRLVKPEQFSGFGLAPGPELTLVQGERRRPRPAAKKVSAKTTTPAAPTTAEDDETTAASKQQPGSAARRRLARAAERARAAFADADEGFAAAEAAERRAHEQVRTLTDELAALQRELDTAKRDLDAARKQTRSARTTRRQAQSAMDRAERQLDAGTDDA